MKNEDKLPTWETILLSYQARLRVDLNWYPYPAFISFLLVWVLSGHILPGLNPRLGSLSNVATISAKPSKQGSIWLGLYAKEGRIHALTSDRTKFSWPQDSSDPANMKHLVKYLKTRVHKEILATGMSMEANLIRIKAVLAVDETLSYAHIRPVIYALGEARISKYGFETRLLN